MKSLDRWNDGVRSDTPVNLKAQIISNIVDNLLGLFSFRTIRLTILLIFIYAFCELIDSVSEYFTVNASCYVTPDSNNTVIVQCNKEAINNITKEAIKYTKKGFIMTDRRLLGDQFLMYYKNK